MTTPEACAICGSPARVVTERRLVRLGRRSVEVEDTFARCERCGEEYYLPGQLEATQRRAADVVRQSAGRLSPDDIRRLRTERLGLSQAALEQLIAAGPKTVVRWERGTVIPNGPADSLLRLLVEYSHAAEYLAQLHQVSLSQSAETPRLATFPAARSSPGATFSAEGGASEPVSEHGGHVRRWDRKHRPAPMRSSHGGPVRTLHLDELPHASHG